MTEHERAPELRYWRVWLRVGCAVSAILAAALIWQNAESRLTVDASAVQVTQVYTQAVFQVLVVLTVLASVYIITRRDT